jgi:hypothetical protein
MKMLRLAVVSLLFISISQHAKAQAITGEMLTQIVSNAAITGQDGATAVNNFIIMHMIPRPAISGGADSTYVYTGDNPLTRTDPKGEFWFEAIIWLGIGGVAIQQLAELYNNSHLQMPFPTLQPHPPFPLPPLAMCNAAYPTGFTSSNTNIYAISPVREQQELPVPEMDTLPEGPYVGLLPAR